VVLVAVAVAALDQAFFFIPGRLGAMEGVRFLMLSSVGAGEIHSLAYGLVARVEQLFWSGLGILAYFWCLRRVPGPADKATSPETSPSF
jgi:hypothetical protein